MRLYYHYCSFGFSNCYILGSDVSDENQVPSGQERTSNAEPKEAVIVDPGNMDDKILRYIENNEYSLKGVLLTHDHINHSHGLLTLKKIYDTEIYCINPAAMDFRTNIVRDGEKISIGSFKIEIIAVPGHSMDSAVYKVERLLFTGDVLTAGLVGRTANIYAAANQMTALQSKILSLPGDYTVLPGHGPPSTLEAERRFNTGINLFKDRMKNRNFTAVN